MSSKNERPLLPGDIIKFNYMKPLGLTEQQLADRLGISRIRVHEILSGKRSITPDTSIRLSKLFKTTPDYWLKLQIDVKIRDMMQANKNEYQKIKPIDLSKLEKM